MPMQRLFIIAPSVARLIRKERGGERVREGYFPDQPQRSTFVQIEETRSSLILEAGADGAFRGAGGPAACPCAGPARSQPRPGGVPAHQALHRLTRDPGPSLRQARSPRSGGVASAPEDGQDLPPLPWFGPEVSAEPAYQRRRLALDGAPDCLGAGCHERGSQQPARSAGGPGHHLARCQGKPRDRTNQQLMPLHARMLLSPSRRPRRMRRSMISALRTRSSASWPALCSHGGADRSWHVR